MMPTANLLDIGRRFASHWSSEENNITPLPAGRYEVLRKARRQNYRDIAVDYYNLTTNNIAFGWNEAFHFCPFPDPCETIDSALKRHQHYLALVMGLKAGMRGLDAGCGLGPVSRDLARLAGVHVTGVSINSEYVRWAREEAKDQGVEDVDYVEGDFMDLSQFPDSTFDFAYAIEATVYAPSLCNCYTEIARTLKPGGVFAVYEWLMTPSPYGNFSPTNPRHLDIRQRLERGDGITNIVTIPEGLKAFKDAGLQLYRSEDRGKVEPNGRTITGKKWWYHVDGDLKGATTWKDWWTVLRLQPWFWKMQCALACVIEWVGWCEKGRYEALATQGQAVWGMRDGAREDVFTCMYLMAGRKPVDWKPKPEKKDQ